MLPTRKQAEEILREAETCNPGPWGDHSRCAARCAESIAECCPGMDAEKAYITGLLHDIGRKFGKRHLGHVCDGYTYMMKLGFDEAARVCLSHSFNTGDVESYIGRFDVSDEEMSVITTALAGMTFDEYDWLIQLCDSLAGAEGVMDMEARMSDVKRRYGYYPQDKWDRNYEIRAWFEEKTGRGLYEMLKDKTVHP